MQARCRFARRNHVRCCSGHYKELQHVRGHAPTHAWAPPPFPLQDCIELAQPGDTVHLLPGHYKESLLVRKPLHLTCDAGVAHVASPGRFAVCADAPCLLENLALKSHRWAVCQRGTQELDKGGDWHGNTEGCECERAYASVCTCMCVVCVCVCGMVCVGGWEGLACPRGGGGI